MAGGGVFVNITASVRAPDVRALAIAAGWDGLAPITLVINAGVDVASLSIPATIPHDCLTILNYGRIGGVINSGVGLTTVVRISINNQGTIFGGGGRGGYGGSAYYRWTSSDALVTSAGGVYGAGAGFSSSGTVTMVAATSGVAGTKLTYTGDMIGGATAAWCQGGIGGVGGAIGIGGGNGSAGTYLKGSAYAAGQNNDWGSGTAAGNAVTGNSLITWVNLGTITGPRA